MQEHQKHGLATYLMLAVIALDIAVGAFGAFNDSVGEASFAIPVIVVNFAAGLLAAGKYAQAALSGVNTFGAGVVEQDSAIEVDEAPVGSTDASA